MKWRVCIETKGNQGEVTEAESATLNNCLTFEASSALPQYSWLFFQKTVSAMWSFSSNHSSLCHTPKELLHIVESLLEHCLHNLQNFSPHYSPHSPNLTPLAHSNLLPPLRFLLLLHQKRNILHKTHIELVCYLYILKGHAHLYKPSNSWNTERLRKKGHQLRQIYINTMPLYNQIPELTLRHSIGTGNLVTNPEVFHLSVSTSDHSNQARTVEISRNQRTLSPITQVFSTRE